VTKNRQERFDLKISKSKILWKQRHLNFGCPWGKPKHFKNLISKWTILLNINQFMSYKKYNFLAINPTTVIGPSPAAWRPGSSDTWLRQIDDPPFLSSRFYISVECVCVCVSWEGCEVYWILFMRICGVPISESHTHLNHVIADENFNQKYLQYIHCKKNIDGLT